MFNSKSTVLKHYKRGYTCAVVVNLRFTGVWQTGFWCISATVWTEFGVLDSYCVV